MLRLFLPKFIFVFAMALSLFGTAPSLSIAGTAPIQVKHVQTHLVSSHSQITPNQAFQVSWRIIPDPAWHVYWKNPGDTGLAAEIDWNLPKGWQASSLSWPTPEVIETPPLVNYGYEHTLDLVQTLTAPSSFNSNTLQTLTANVTFLMCKDICLPGEATLELPLMLGDTPIPNPTIQEQFNTRNIPQSAPSKIEAYQTETHFFITYPSAWGQARFIPFTEGVIEDANPQLISNKNNQIILQIERDAWRNMQPEVLEGLLLLPNGQSYTITPKIIPCNAAICTLKTPQQLTQEDSSFVWLLLKNSLFALLAGLILNLMPCVLPVLALKTFSLAKLSHTAATKYVIGYTLGIILSLWALAASLVLFQSFGLALGWGFHLQSPWFVGGMVLFLTAMALNLAGIFNLNIPSLTTNHHTGAFGTGLLVVLLATPCTAPFMGVAVAYALTQSIPVTLTIFTGLGLGLALPLIIFAFTGKQILPKPGTWLTPFKQFLAFPLLATALWLAWIFASLTTSASGYALLAVALGLGFCLWVWHHLTPRWRWALLALLVAESGFLYSTLIQTNQIELEWQPWSPQITNTITQPTLLNATADWCITCKVTEKLLFQSKSFAKWTKQNNVKLIVADWTKQDDDITKLLNSFNRQGVPLYVLYVPGKAPQVLPQLPSVKTLDNALKD